ncbi:MAG: glutamine synthetase type III, partial [Lachnospiraceae bacterium]|nr:glutamine synthetase type III [Lachnospiraceae bacterium]
DGYSDEWVAEAARRGLPNIKSMIEAACALTTDKSVALFERFKIFNRTELESREEIIYETYAKTINIEALTMIDMAGKQIIPAAVKYSGELARTVNEVKAAGVNAAAEDELLKKAIGYINDAQTAYNKLKEVSAHAVTVKDGRERAFYYKDVVKSAMDELRSPCDELEMIVDKSMWPIPTYAELMFEV